MAPTDKVGKLNLEGLMSRAEILFTAGYVFKGELDIEGFKDSFHTIVDSIAKLNHQLDFKAQNEFHWKPSDTYNERFHVFESEDIENELKEVSARGFDIRASSNNFPMNLVIIKSTHPEEKDKFVVAKMWSHEFIDARSAESIFHLIVDHYNAKVKGDADGMQTAEKKAQQLHTLDAGDMVEKVKSADYDHQENAEHLASYAISDEGDYGVRIATLSDLLPEFAKRKRFPVSCIVDAKPMIARCREAYPEASKNAIITAVLHKALYNINVTHKGKPEHQIISGKTVSDLLSPELREQYIGNYIAFVPVSTPGEISIEDMSKQIHDRIVVFKSKQINLTCFELVEQAANANVVGTADDELSYVITNWNNYRFLSDKTFIEGCESVAHYSAVNVDPLDAGGAALINRAIVVINLSLDDQLCFSMFPSLRNDEENKQLIAEVERLFNEVS